MPYYRLGSAKQKADRMEKLYKITEEVELVRQLRSEGRTLQEIADIFGKSLTWVSARLTFK